MIKNFSKPALSTIELINFLKQRSLRIESQQNAVAKLQTVGYYRFSAYFQPFIKSNSEQRQFMANTSFDQIWDLYSFDSELRFLIYAALEKIEIAFRAAINDQICLQYQPDWYQEPKHFRNKYYHEQLLKKVDLICQTKEEPFIRHYYANYRSPDYPPGWMIIQCMTFGNCCSVFKNIKSLADLKEITQLFKQQSRIIESWMRSLCYARNICAHHARLWNRWFIIRPIQAKHNWPIQSPARSLHEQIAVILSLLACLGQKDAWQDKLHALFAVYPDVPYELMGFASKWRLDPIWQMPS